MIAKINTLSVYGLEGKTVVVEVDIANGLFEFNIVGMAGKSVLESKKRVVAALKNAGFKMPMKHITVNLTPADFVKSATSFDLPIAVGILVASGQMLPPNADDYFWGELSLNGSLVNTNGALASALACHKQTSNVNLYLPQINVQEAGIVQSVNIMPANDIRSIVASYAGKPILKYRYVPSRGMSKVPDLWLLNNSKLIRALIISIVGKHNLLMVGPPGVGKSYLAKITQHLMPTLNEENAIEVSKIYSVAGLLNNKIRYQSPFRAPHHSITRAAFIGGGAQFKPGEISLAHQGILFLDEFNMFAGNIIELLRQPLEDKHLYISRGGYNLDLPCDFILYAAMNPCKCGNSGVKDKTCTCTIIERKNYWHRISKPILDRIDMQIFVANNAAAYISDHGDKTRISLQEIRNQVDDALKFRQERSSEVKNRADNLAIFDRDARDMVINATESLGLSLRGYYKVVKLARTIADIEKSTFVHKVHTAEAISYRLTGFDGYSIGG